MRSGYSALLLVACLASEARAASLEQAVSQTIRKNYGALHACYRRALAVDRSKQGTVFIRVTLGRKGLVRKAVVARDALGDRRVSACVARWISGWTFAGAEAAGARAGDDLLIPITFRAAKKQYAVRTGDAPLISLPGGNTVQLLLKPKNVGAKRASMVLWTVAREAYFPAIKGCDQAVVIIAGRGRIRGAGRWRAVGARDAASLSGSGALLRVTKGPLRVIHLLFPAVGEENLIQILKRGIPPRPRVGAVRVVRARRVKRLVIAGGKLRVLPLLHRTILGHSRFYLGILKAQKGLSVPEHAHLAEAELLHLLAGFGRMRLGNVPSIIGANQAVYIPGGKAHSLAVGEDLEALQIYAPAGPEQRFFKAAAKR